MSRWNWRRTILGTIRGSDRSSSTSIVIAAAQPASLFRTSRCRFTSAASGPTSHFDRGRTARFSVPVSIRRGLSSTARARFRLKRTEEAGFRTAVRSRTLAAHATPIFKSHQLNRYPVSRWTGLIAARVCLNSSMIREGTLIRPRLARRLTNFSSRRSMSSIVL